MNAFLGTISNALYFRDPRRHAYFLVGIISFFAVLVTYAVGFRVRAVLPAAGSFAFSVATGMALLGCVLYQWMLFFARLRRDAAACRTHYRVHRLVGSATIVLFVLHGSGFGYALVTLMALAFVVVAATGLFNKEIMVLRRPWLRTLWDVCHIGLSGILLPLIALHVWAALAFK